MTLNLKRMLSKNDHNSNSTWLQLDYFTALKVVWTVRTTTLKNRFDNQTKFFYSAKIVIIDEEDRRHSKNTDRQPFYYLEAPICKENSLA